MERTNLEFTRGDSYSLNVRIYNEQKQEIIIGDKGEIYFTLKKNYEVSSFLIQKKLNDGIKYVENKGYVISLDPKDTNKLDYGKYVFDIEYKLENFVKTVAIGTIKLTNEVTFEENEV